MIRISRDKDPKKLAIRFMYNKDTVAKVKSIPGSKFKDKKGDKHWIIDYYKIKQMTQMFDSDDLIIDSDVDINYYNDKFDFSNDFDMYEDYRFKDFSYWALSLAPDTFFTNAASYKVNDYPKYAHEEGGIARLTSATMKVAYTLSQFIETEELDIILVSILLENFYFAEELDSIDAVIQLIEDNIVEVEKDNILYIYNMYWKTIKKMLKSKKSEIKKIAQEITKANYLEVNFNKKLIKGGNK